MTRRLIESMSGMGVIHADGQLLRRTNYELSLWSDEQPHAPGEDPKESREFEGHIDITGIAEAVVLAGPRKLTLTTEDGRRLEFQLASTDGRIVGLRWL